jgi:hypothetical protein
MSGRIKRNSPLNLSRKMKITITSLTILLTTFSIFGQKFDLGAIEVMGITSKITGKIVFSDSLLKMKLLHKGKLTNIDYDIINKRNGIIYVTDGVETFKTTIYEDVGKKKGFKFTQKMTFIQPNGTISFYYLNADHSSN